ncbi:hypothetical protein PHMEG_0005999 [Phytophthora megakarya]|uniref:PH domain-containing protein n=1 Tax=Phytophthora megakarya TaxID=4795 RepID=A0A225WRP4_9STRA|nr:hypothetical protein PHMEG_0005999 [Phytophthora megakarya]
MKPSTPPLAPNAPNSGVLLLGKLMRRDRRLFTWKWRDFVLERTRLQYFSEKGNRKGDIPLSPHTPITIRMVSEPKPFGFLLFIKDTKLTLAAATERERHQWIDVFCDVFHASVEQAPTDNKAERRARPTYLPIPDLGDDDMDHNSSASNLVVQTNSVDGDIVDGGLTTPVMAHNVLDSDHVGHLRRDSFGEDVIPILESRMTYGPLKEMYSRITFPPSLANGDLLVGVGPIVRRMGWTDERILAVGMYIDPETATKELEKFNGRVAKSLYGDQQFYDHLLFSTTFRRSYVVTARKRVSKSVLTALLRDELAPRMGPDAAALHTFLGFIEKSLKKAESMVIRIHEDDRFEYRLRGQLYPPIASHALCKCIQAVFFDSNSIQHDAKRGLVERLPSLWGGEVLDVQDEIFGSLHERIQGMDSEDEEDSDSDDDDDDDFDDDDSEAEDLFGAAGNVHCNDEKQSHHGTLFSYYSHKRSRKYRDMMELTRCEVVEITANSGPDVARFAWEKGENDSIRIAIIKPNGEILALRTETIYEGEEWLESLTDASNEWLNSKCIEQGTVPTNADDDMYDEDVDEYDSDHDLVEKDGSLLAWVQEDPRHAIIAVLLILIVYLASVMHRQPVGIGSIEQP